MRFALLLLWLTTLAPAAHAADWLTWRRVAGDPHLGAVHHHHSRLRAPNGRYDGPQQDRALIITYRRDIDREALVEQPRDQWRAQEHSALGNRAAKHGYACCRGSGRTSRRSGFSWRSWFAAARAVLVPRQRPREPPLPRSARASRRRSAPAFSPSGSIRAPLIPNCVSS